MVPYSGVPPVFDDRTRDACIVVPGIVGSVLRDTATGRPLWGVPDDPPHTPASPPEAP
ncbi:hypothetical protein ACFVFS_11715 [Kitasatospora sp. NPDC057692]|uniref:hypothetical protein n=1 Tax=Kitasatospora sp. NPDC057692 TaxID=3346215 RepID=UPI003686854D